MTQDTYTQLQEAEARLRRAQEAERQRIAAQNAGQDEIDALQEMRDALAAQAREDRFNALSAQNDALIGQIRAAHAELITRLDSGDVRAARVSASICDQLWQQHQRTRQAALAAVAPEINAREAADPLTATLTPAQRSVITDRGIALRAQHAYASRLQQQYGYSFALIKWITESPDATERQRRQGLVYALDGQLWDPASNYDADAAYRAQLNPVRW